MKRLCNRSAYILATIGLLVLGCAPASPSPAAAPAKPPAVAAAPAAGSALEQLVAAARQESSMSAMLNVDAAKAAQKVADGFKKRFELNRLDVKIDASGGETPAFQKAIAETQSGAPPAFDTMQAEEGNTFNLISAGGALAVDNWQQLLREINPLVASGGVSTELISPSVFAGMGFRYLNRDYGLYYNTDRVKSDADLPSARADAADPRFQGKFAVQQFVIEYQYGTLVYPDKQQWLETVDKIGKNATVVLAPAAVRERLLLGEFDFGSNVQNTGAYLRVKAQDSKAPLGLRYYTDYTPVTNLMYSVRKGSKSPASATLFALWMTTPEAHAIRQAEDWYANLLYPTTDLDRQIKQQLDQSGTRTVAWLDNEQSFESLKWFATDEGKQYAESLGKALTQRRQ